MPELRLSRRQVLAGGGAVAAATAGQVSPAAARIVRGDMPWEPGEADAPRPDSGSGYAYFTPEEAEFVEAAVARIIPADEIGPGAHELGVPVFIDRQLAGEYGRAERWYMLGPWRPGTDNQGYQSRLTPAQLYRFGIKAVDEHVRTGSQARGFAGLSTSDQDSLLQALEDDKVALAGVSGKTFFDVLLQNTIEGFFADPIHGGNRNMEAWRMIGFPGARYDYRDYVGKHGERFPLPPVSLQGRPAWNANGRG